MDLGQFFSPYGRSDQKAFWMGVLILFVGGVLIHAVVVVGTLIWLLSSWCWICLYARRLHDAGRSGWLQLLPWAVGIALMAIGLPLGLAGGLGALFTGLPHFLAVGFLGGLVWLVGLFLLSGLAHLFFVLWVGLLPSEPGPNRYGPPTHGALMAAGYR